MNKRDSSPNLEQTQAGAPFPLLFLNTCRALSCGRLRFKPRERQLALLLAVESFGRGEAAGKLDLVWLWDRLRPSWRQNELEGMLEDWRRAGWIAVDQAAGEYRLAPDRLPGWADCFPSPEAPPGLELRAGEQIGNMVAELSQARASSAGVEPFARPSNSPRAGPGCENFAPCDAKLSQPGPYVNVPETFKRSDVSTNKRLTLAPCENFAAQPLAPSDGERAGERGTTSLQARVAAFVGAADWTSQKFWNSGQGWRGRIFAEEAAALERALNYVQAGLQSGETRLRKTRGAMLWDQFQRERREKLQQSTSGSGLLSF